MTSDLPLVQFTASRDVFAKLHIAAIGMTQLNGAVGGKSCYDLFPTRSMERRST